MADEGTHIIGGHRRPVQRARVKPGGWTKPRRARFLKVLGETCNVSLAARTAGATGSPYVVRRRDPAFAQLWDEALEIGYDRLETSLLQRALEGINDIDLGALFAEEDSDGETAAEAVPGAAAGDDAAAVIAGGNRPSPAFGERPVRNAVQLALTLLARRRAAGAKPARGRKPMSSDEVDALLLQKLDSLARKLRPAR